MPGIGPHFIREIPASDNVRRTFLHTKTEHLFLFLCCKATSWLCCNTAALLLVPALVDVIRFASRVTYHPNTDYDYREQKMLFLTPF